MKSLVAYATRHGNTRVIADAIASTLAASGPVVLSDVRDIETIDPDIDLVVVGGPTEGHGMTESVADFFDRMVPGAVAAASAAAFDTRLRWPRFLSGSAATAIAIRFDRAGAKLVVEPESFLVTMKPELEPGEVQRAAAWGAALADKVRNKVPNTAALGSVGTAGSAKHA